MPVHSAAYRSNEQAILEGRPQIKYTRIPPFVPGDKIIEIGAAEGVLALMLAKEKASVTSVELRKARHDAALRLWKLWGSPSNVKFVNGDIVKMPELFDGKDTLVAIRMIYHLRAGVHDMMRAAQERGVKNIVLGGNRNRERNWLAGIPGSRGEWDVLSTRTGMKDLLATYGYHVTNEDSDGLDPIVVGER